MNKEQLIEYLNTYKEQSSLKEHITKIYLHKDVLPVIEFTSEDRVFAFDVKPLKEKIELKLCWRKDSRQYSDFISFKKTVTEQELFSILETTAQRALDFVKCNGSILVSVIIPVYNRALVISRLIDSLKQQTLDKSKFEVIFIDDCSTDDTVQKINKSAEGLNYRVISTPFNSGSASLPRNFGIKTAVGDYLFFADSDDYLSPDTLNDAVTCATKNSNDIIYLNYESTVPEKRSSASRIWNGPDVKSKADVFKNYLLLSLTPYKLFNTYFLRSNNLFFNTELSNTAEQLFITSCVAKSSNIAILKSKSYYYLTTDPALDHMYNQKQSDDMIYKLWSESIVNVLKVEDYTKKSKLFNSLYYRFATKYHKVFREKKNKPLMNQLLKIVTIFENNSSLFDEALIFRNGLDNVVFVRNTLLKSAQSKSDGISKVIKLASKLIQKTEVIQDNNIMIFNDDGKSKVVDSIPNLNVKFTGRTGLVKIHESVAIKGKCNITLGDKSAVVISRNVNIDSIDVVLKAKSCTLWIGENTSIIKSSFISNHADSSEIIVDKNCFIDNGSKFIASVPYSIIDKTSNKIINSENFGIHIGESVYISPDSTIMDNVVIPASCLVRNLSVVYSSKIVSGSVLAGNPAVTVNTGVYWKKESPQKVHNQIF